MFPYYYKQLPKKLVNLPKPDSRLLRVHVRAVRVDVTFCRFRRSDRPLRASKRL